MENSNRLTKFSDKFIETIKEELDWALKEALEEIESAFDGCFYECGLKGETMIEEALQYEYEEKYKFVDSVEIKNAFLLLAAKILYIRNDENTLHVHQGLENRKKLRELSHNFLIKLLLPFHKNENGQ